MFTAVKKQLLPLIKHKRENALQASAVEEGRMMQQVFETGGSLHLLILHHYMIRYACLINEKVPLATSSHSLWCDCEQVIYMQFLTNYVHVPSEFAIK